MIARAIRWAFFLGGLAGALPGQESPPPLEEVARRNADVALPVEGFAPVAKGIDPRAVRISARIAAKIDAALLDPADGATAKGIAIPLLPVAVTAEGQPGAPERIAAAIRAAGGTVTGVLRNTVLARVPRGAVPLIAARDDVQSVAAQPVLLPMQDDPPPAVVGAKGLDVVRATGVERFHRQGIRGRGVRVGILDFGFLDYQRWETAGRLPAPKGARAFNDAGKMEGSGEGNGHGTACAEIIHDLAPEADLYLAAAGGSLDQFTRAVSWLVSQGVQIISFSGGMSAGPHDGRAPMDWLVNQVVDQNRVLWVNASGNMARAHWTGDAGNHDADGWIRFGEETGKRLFFRTDRPDCNVNVLWDDWTPDARSAASRPAVDAYLFRFDPTAREPAPYRSTVFNKGQQPPMAHFELTVPVGATMILALRASPVRRPLRVHVFIHGGHVYPAVPERSLSIPATAAGSLTVGAVNIRTGGVEEFSSRGPTDDNRDKPDLSAFDDVQSLVYDQGFSGTSAAAPVVAGFAALVQQSRPDLSGPTLRTELLHFVRAPEDRLSPAYGRGILDASLPVVRPATRSKSFALEGEAEVPLPEALGGPATREALDYLFANAAWFRAFEAAITLNKPGPEPVYFAGERAAVSFQCADSCYYAVLRRAADGTYSLVTAGEEPLEAGRRDAYPHAGETGLAIGEPPGREAFVLIAAAERIAAGELSAGRAANLSRKLSVVVAEFQSGR